MLMDTYKYVFKIFYNRAIGIFIYYPILPGREMNTTEI